jgi:hypothetical protein
MLRREETALLRRPAQKWGEIGSLAVEIERPDLTWFDLSRKKEKKTKPTTIFFVSFWLH